MDKTFAAVAVITAGLIVLAAACQNGEKGKSFGKWHLSPPPSTAAGYDAPPLQPESPPDTPPATVSPGYDKSPTTQPPEEKPENPPAAGGYGPAPPSPSWKIVPPPSAAAGYGK